MTRQFKLFLLGVAVFLFGLWIGQAQNESSWSHTQEADALEQAYADGWREGARFVAIRTLPRAASDAPSGGPRP